jgi:hypothetical protein
MENTEQHPITPRPEIVRWWHSQTPSYNAPIDYVATAASRWGADQELAACCEWVSKYLPYLGDFPMPEDKLRAARRPKQPSLKEQALALLQTDPENQPFLSEKGIAILRKALEALPND